MQNSNIITDGEYVFVTICDVIVCGSLHNKWASGMAIKVCQNYYTSSNDGENGWVKT